MTHLYTRSNFRLSASELAFQEDQNNWKSGPAFDIRFIFETAFNSSDFENALQHDPLRVHESRYDKPGRVLLWHEGWPTCAGAHYYDFKRLNGREPTIFLNPAQYRAMAGVRYLTNYKGKETSFAKFLRPLISLAARITTTCNAQEALLFTQEYYPNKSSESEILPNIFVDELLLGALS